MIFIFLIHTCKIQSLYLHFKNTFKITFLTLLGFEFRALSMVGKYSATEIDSQLSLRYESCSVT